MGKESFIIYKSFYKPISKLSDKQLGRLFRAIFEYNISGVVSVEDDIEMAFEFFKNQFDIDESKYQGIVKRNQENGRRGGIQGGRKSNNPNNPMGATGGDCYPNNPMGAYNDNVNDNVNDNDNDSLSMREYEPSQIERENFLRILLFEKCLIKPAEELDRFLAHYTKTGWVDKNGNKIVSKDAALKAWSTQEAAAFEKPMVFRWYQFFNRVIQNCDKSIQIDKMPFLTDFRGLQQENDKLIIYCSESLRNQIETALNTKIIAELNELGIKKLNYKFKN